MDRIAVQFGALPLDTDILNTNRFAMTGLGVALLAVLGSGTYVDGLACTPTGGALSVQIAPGSIYTVAGIDATAYGSLAADTADQIVQQGIVFGSTALSFAAPTTAAQSITYLIEAQFQQVDSNPVALNYYNSANPSTPLLGTATNTMRKGVCALQVKAGVSAVSPSAPSVDTGWVPLYTVTVAYGQTAIVSNNIATSASAPFIAHKVGQLGAISTLNIGAGLVNDGAGNLATSAANLPDYAYNLGLSI